ncbi:6483_t:CDS:1, partial [Cetraspora pellucida]
LLVNCDKTLSGSVPVTIVIQNYDNNFKYPFQNGTGKAKALIPTKRKLLSFNMSSASNKRTKTEVNRASNKAFDLLTKEEKVDKKVNTGKSSTLKSPSIVETGLAKDKELD